MEKPALVVAASLALLLASVHLPAQQAAQPGMQQTLQHPLQQTLTLPTFLSSHMVLQRNAPIHLWGTAGPGDRVTVTLNTGTAKTTTNPLGQWSVYLPPQPAGGPYDLTVTGPTSTETRTDIMLGDLWLASGQSNMEMPLSGWGPRLPIRNSAEEVASANLPDLRLLLVPRASAEHPLQDIAATWQRCTPDTAKSFSAVAFFFGRELLADQHVAIGIIDSTWGGTPAEAWVSTEGLADPDLSGVWSAYADFLNADAQLQPVLAAEKREDEAALAAGKPKPSHPWHPQAESFRPAGLYNGMIAPLTPLTIRGVIWYQGETNSGNSRIANYQALFAAHIADWRTHFAQGNFPFLFAQIAAFDSPPEEHWGAAREVQRRTLAVANTAMAVTLDTGEQHNGHPANKQAAGHRLALAARSLVYGESVHAAGPLFLRADRENTTGQPSALRVRFKDPAEALRCPANTCLGFELAGEDRHFHPATATVQAVPNDNSIVVTSTAVSTPAYVRYAWPSWTDANLVDTDGLPASTFTSEPTVTGTSN